MISTALTLAIIAGFPIICLAIIVYAMKRHEADAFLDDPDDWGAQ